VAKNSFGSGCAYYHVTETFGESYLNAATIAITMNGFQEVFQAHEISEEKSVTITGEVYGAYSSYFRQPAHSSLVVPEYISPVCNAKERRCNDSTMEQSSRRELATLVRNSE
jgi:hypothetical protein